MPLTLSPVYPDKPTLLSGKTSWRWEVDGRAAKAVVEPVPRPDQNRQDPRRLAGSHMRWDQKGRARRPRIAMCRGLCCAVRQPGCDGPGVIRLWLRQGAERAEEDSGDQAGHQNKVRQTRKYEDPLRLAAVASYDHLRP